MHSKKADTHTISQTDGADLLVGALARAAEAKKTADRVSDTRNFGPGEQITSCRGASVGLLLSRVVQKEIAAFQPNAWPGRPRLVVVTPNEARARELADELDFFLGPCPLGDPSVTIDWGTVMPENPEMAYGDLGPDMELELQRMAVCFRLSQGFCGPVLLLSAAALSQKIMRRAAFDDLCDLVGPKGCTLT